MAAAPNGEADAPKVSDEPPMGFAPKSPVLEGWLVVVPKRPLDVVDVAPKAEPAGLNADETPKLEKKRRKFFGGRILS